MAAQPIAEATERLGKLIHGIRTAMMVTIDERNQPRSRPMYTQDTEFDGNLWFFTDKESKKVEDIARNALVHLTYATTAGERYVSLNGMAYLLNDRIKINELWSPFLKASFQGPDDPDLRLIRVEVMGAEFWDSPGGKIGSVLSIAKAMVTGEQDDGGYRAVTFKESGGRKGKSK